MAYKDCHSHRRVTKLPRIFGASSHFSTRIFLYTLHFLHEYFSMPYSFLHEYCYQLYCPLSFVDTKMYQTVNVCVHGSYRLTIGFHLPCLQLLCDIKLHVNYEFLFMQKQSYTFSTMLAGALYCPIQENTRIILRVSH